jgi:hypothetical protein
VTNGDGILLDGQTLYVVPNRSDLVVEVDFEPGVISGEVGDEITDLASNVPTTTMTFSRSSSSPKSSVRE